MFILPKLIAFAPTRIHNEDFNPRLFELVIIRILRSFNILHLFVRMSPVMLSNFVLVLLFNKNAIDQKCQFRTRIFGLYNK